MSEQQDPKDRSKQVTEKPGQAPSGNQSQADFEADALLDTLLADPFPVQPAPPKPPLPPPPRGGLHYPHDEVTVVGQGIEELLAQSFSESGPPAPLPAAGTPASAAEGTRPLPPRPVGPPRPRATPQPGPLAPPRRQVLKADTPVVPQTPEEDILASIQPEFLEDEETRVLKLPSGIPIPGTPSSAPPPAGQTIRAPDPAAAAAASAAIESDEPDAPTEPPRLGVDAAHVPLAPRVPSLPAQLVAAELGVPLRQEPEAALESSASPTAPPQPTTAPTGRGSTVRLGNFPMSPEALMRSEEPTIDRFTSSSAPPPAIAEAGGAIDPIAREAWIARAEWLESEAHSAADPQAKARALLVSSEMWAIIGDVGRAREVATEASAVVRQQGMVGRQQRWLAALEADYNSVASLLDVETRSAQSPEARLHAAYLGAELQRLQLDDREAAKKKIEQCAHLQPEDPRAHVTLLCEELATTAAPPKLRLPESEELSALSAAVDHLSSVRAPAADGVTPLDALDAARHALADGERGAAADALLALVTIPELERSAKWLASSLLAPEAERRAQSISLLESLLGEGGASARRALVARSLEAERPSALERALESGAEVFSAADRVALAALSGREVRGSESLLQELEQAPSKAALAAGVVLSGRLTSSEEPTVGTPTLRTLVNLGRLMARPPSQREDLEFLRFSVEALKEFEPEHPLPKVLGLELALAKNDEKAVASQLADWPRGKGDKELGRDGETAAAFIYEVAGEHEAAKLAYERVLAAAPTSEFAARALIAQADAGKSGEILEHLADAQGQSLGAALHLIEAALKRGDDDDAVVDVLLDKAVQADPKLLLAYRVGFDLAQKKADVPRQLAWLRARRAVHGDPLQTALDLYREARALLDSNVETASQLLKEAVDLSPGDVGLWELYEKLDARSPEDRAHFREAAAAKASGPAKDRLLVEAALDYETLQNPEASVTALRGASTTNTGLARVMRERLAPGTSEATHVAEELIGRAKASEDPREQRDLYERLFEIDRARGDSGSALLWQDAILEAAPEDLPALRRLEAAHIAADRKEDLERVEAALTRALSGPDLLAPARLATRLRLLAGKWAETRPLVERVMGTEPNALWALRLLAALARAADEPELLLDLEQRLYAQASRPLDQATLSLRAAESAARLERWELAQGLLEKALEHCPDHLVALTTLAAVLEAREDFAGAARAQESVAEASRVDAHRVAALYHAGVLWLDRADNPEQGRAALEQAVAIDLGHDEAVSRLQSLYVARGDRQRLADLLARRLERTTDPEERIAIEVTRGRALAEVGEPAAARAALAAALDANPDHLEALETFAEVCLGEGDWLGAEQAFIRLARHSAEPARQAQIYRRLAELYDTSIPNPERAELAYQEVLKREPDDEASVERLVQVYGRMNDKQKAVATQTQLLERAKTPEQRRDRLLRLAVVHEQIALEPKQAESMLDKARKEAPYDAAVLRALIELQQRQGETRPAQMLLDRASADCRRALGTGRFEPALFEILATVSDLRGATDAAAVAHATLAALSGSEIGVPGAGPAAGAASLDDLLAPDLLAGGLRALLRRTGEILDTAYPVDVRALKATALPPSAAGYEGHVQEVARAFGFPSVHVMVSPALGSTCMPAGSSPAVLIFGQALLESSDDAARYCLLVRALKVLQGRAATVARTAPIDLWPMIAGLLSLLAPSWSPLAVDAKKLSEAQARIQAVMPAEKDPELASLALEVSTIIGNRASQLGTQVFMWGNRAALLAVGSPLPALRAIALTASGGQPPPAAGPERVKWIVRNAEARDLAIFSVSDPYAEARRRLRLG